MSIKSFGVAIGFLLPGFIATWGLSFQSELIASWLQGGSDSEVTVGGMLFSTVVALGLGLFASTVRWMVLDSLHHRTGISKPSWDYRRLQASIGAYQILQENHYRFYQFYGNSLCALLYSWASWKIATANWFAWSDLGLTLASLVLYLGSRDTLRKYYDRVTHLLDSENP